MTPAGATLGAFALLETTLCLIPGPAVMLTVSTALRRGGRRGVAAMSGIVAGNTLYFVLSALGVVALVLASYRVFTVAKWAGAAYLAFLGLRALFARAEKLDEARALDEAHALAEAHALDEAHALGVEGAARPPGPARGAFASGFVTQVANPKAIVFFAAVLPQFVEPHGNLPLQMLALALVSQSAEVLVLSGYIAAAAFLRRGAAASRASLWIERAGGAVLLAIAAQIVREPLVVR